MPCFVLSFRINLSVLPSSAPIPAQVGAEVIIVSFNLTTHPDSFFSWLNQAKLISESCYPKRILDLES